MDLSIFLICCTMTHISGPALDPDFQDVTDHFALRVIGVLPWSGLGTIIIPVSMSNVMSLVAD